MPKVISAFAWNKTEDVGVPPQRQIVIGKRKNGEDLVSIVDDECLVIFEGKIKRSRYLTAEKRWEGHKETQIPEYWIKIRYIKFVEKE